MRASNLVLGPLLAREGHAIVSLPGGCAIGARPMDIHIDALEMLGAKIDLRDGYLFATAAKGLKGCAINLPFASVGATENLIMAASMAKGTTIITNAACEPEVGDMIECLISMGAIIEGKGTSKIIIEGVSQLYGAKHAVISDRSAMLMEHTLRVNGDEVWHDSSDGVIISTPIGSSAYSMSAGGPVIFQDSDVFGIISVNSLDITRRPLIVSNSSVIEVDEISSRLHCEVVLDGLDRYKVKNSVEATNYEPSANIIRLKKDTTAISAIAKKVKLAEELFNMPPSSKLLLKTLEYEGSMSQKELVKKTRLPDRTVRLAMSHLLEKGYVKKKVSIRDSRQKIYELSKLINSDLQQ